MRLIVEGIAPGQAAGAAERALVRAARRVPVPPGRRAGTVSVEVRLRHGQSARSDAVGDAVGDAIGDALREDLRSGS